MDIVCFWGLNEWGDVFTIILGISSIITAYATIRALRIQNKLQRDTIVLQQKSQQPIFRIVYEYQSLKNKNDTSIIHIYNDGNAVLYMKNILVQTFFILKVDKKTYQFEVDGYYFKRQAPQVIVGEFFVGYDDSNNDSFCTLYYETIKKTRSQGVCYAISHFDLIKIEYIDINQKTCSVYYKSREPITEKEYRELSSQKIKSIKLDIKKVTLADMLNYISL